MPDLTSVVGIGIVSCESLLMIVVRRGSLVPAY